MRSLVDTVTVWKDDEGMWRWTAFVHGDQPYTSASAGLKTKKAATEEAKATWPEIMVKDHVGPDPRKHVFPGE
jgi:hypothetical protein